MQTVESLHAALGGAEAFWLAVTRLGSDFGYIVIVSLFVWLVNPRGGRQLGITFALSYLVNTALKFGLHEPRPYDLNPAVASAAAKATGTGPGLPSFHAQGSATVWGVMAAQVRSRAFWVVAAVVVLLVSLSRVVLGVHFVGDVLAGLGLGALFVLLGAAFRFPVLPGVTNLAVPLVALVAAAFVPSGLPDYSSALGILAGFWLSRPDFDAPRSWAGRAVFVVVGFVVVFAVYFAFRVIPEDVRHLGFVNALRQGLLILTATDLVPRLLRRFTGGAGATVPA
jgi:hypothetical protein